MKTDFDYQEILNNWDVKKEQQKVDFLEHMYHCAGRQNKSHPMHGLYTGLWQDFCIREAGPAMRDQYFEFKAAVEAYEKSLKESSAT